MNMEIEIYTGADFINFIDVISKLRIQSFKEFPYLYQGKLEYEKKYMRYYAEDKKSTIAIAKINNEIVGASTGIPLMSKSEIVSDAKNIFQQKNIDISDYYYYGEVIVLPKYRGLGLTTKMYAAQENLIKTWGFNHVCILTIVREHNHPLKPVNYKSPDKMWEHLGFRRSHLTTEYDWPTIQPDSTIKVKKNTLEFWTKPLHSI